ncbi:GH25 family lysozyme [Riemerella anatipestifer]|nr:GH25 family lysozyme [Riemerella anatipestifer]
MSVALIGTGIYIKNKVFFYYAMYFKKHQHKKLENSITETKRINTIIAEYQDKVFGIDISHYQRKEDIEWDSLSIANDAINIDFIVLRATMGNGSKDKHFEYFWTQAKKYNYTRGAYHFYRPDEDPVLQANHFLAQVKLEKGDLRPVLDIEKIPIRKSVKQYKEDVKIWLKIVEEAYGAKPIIYTYYHFYKDYLRGDFEGYPLWLANYNHVLVPSEEDNWLFWQFTEKGIVKGINVKVDLNVFNGNSWEFDKMKLD